MKKKLLLLIISCLLFVIPNYAESNLHLRLFPALDTVIGLTQFDPGIGISASVDWAFLSFGSSITTGLSAGGDASIIPINSAASDPLILFEGKVGPFMRYRPTDRLSFRAGLSAGVYQFNWNEVSYTKFLSSASLGLEFHLLPYLNLFADGIYSYRIFTENNRPLRTIGASVGISINMTELMRNRVRVNVEKTRQLRIFPVSWAWYEDNPVAEITVVNSELNAITDVRLSIFMDSYMAQPWEFAHIPRIASGDTLMVPVTALFNEVMLNLTENVNANGEILLQYRSLGMQKEAVFPIQMPIFHRNTLSWDDDRRAAAFVSPRDGAANIFARYVQNEVDLHFRQNANSPILRNVPPNVRYAAAMFEALRLYGISYVVVPALSFVNMHADESALDNVTFPYETLYFRGGDCTYISILFCSLLEALNIKTAFITIPGHLYMAFDVGDDEWFAGSSDIIEIDGIRWLPVEVTVPEEGFVRAWRIGARSWRSSGADAALLPIRECWEVFPSVTVTVSVDYPPEMPPSADVLQAMERELRIFN